MNIKEYISSGILEAYILGELNEQERSEVQKNLALYPELKKALSDAEDVQEDLLMKAAIQPPAGVKEKLFKKIEQPSGKVVPISTQSSATFWKLAVAASVTLAIIASALAYNYRIKWKNTESELLSLNTQNQRIARDYNQVNERLDKIEQDLEVINNPGFKRVIMNGTANAPQSMAYVYWNESSKEVYLSIKNMKALSRENQYQLWAIIDGKPVDAGVFDGNIAGLIKMREVNPGVSMFAVTIEPLGGKPSPTLETMQVAGPVSKG